MGKSIRRTCLVANKRRSECRQSKNFPKKTKVPSKTSKAEAEMTHRVETMEVTISERPGK